VVSKTSAVARKPAAATKAVAKPASKSTARSASKSSRKVAAAAPAPVAVAAPKPIKPRKITGRDKRWLRAVRETLLRRRDELMNTLRSNRDHLSETDKNYSDIADRASGGFEDELAAGLLSFEAGRIDEVEEALTRVDDGTYGLCITCGDAIPQARLEILPFAK